MCVCTTIFRRFHHSFLILQLSPGFHPIVKIRREPKGIQETYKYPGIEKRLQFIVHNLSYDDYQRFSWSTTSSRNIDYNRYYTISKIVCTTRVKPLSLKPSQPVHHGPAHSSDNMCTTLKNDLQQQTSNICANNASANADADICPNCANDVADADTNVRADGDTNVGADADTNDGANNADISPSCTNDVADADTNVCADGDTNDGDTNVGADTDTNDGAKTADIFADSAPDSFANNADVLSNESADTDPNIESYCSL